MAISIKPLWTRKAFAICCSVLTVVFTALAIIGWFEPRYSFMFSLIFSFFAWLFLFHAIFGFANLLSAAQARAIDYVYLGVAAAGVFVLALNYEGRRQDYDFSEKREQLHNKFLSASGDVGLQLARIDSAVCGRSSREKPLFPFHCKLIEKLDWENLKIGSVPDEGKISLEEFMRQFLPAPVGQEDAFERAQRNFSILKEAREKEFAAADDLRFHESRAKTDRDVRDESHGLFTWPFILAFAFALRLTRTTIDVFDWTHRPSPAAQTS